MVLLLAAADSCRAEPAFRLSFEEGAGAKILDGAGRRVGEVSQARWVDGPKGKGLYFDAKETDAARVVFHETREDHFLQTFNEGPFTTSVWI